MVNRGLNLVKSCGAFRPSMIFLTVLMLFTAVAITQLFPAAQGSDAPTTNNATPSAEKIKLEIDKGACADKSKRSPLHLKLNGLTVQSRRSL